MRVRNTRDLGLLLRQERKERGWSQADLAERVGASRHWVMEVERGKPTAEVGLVLRSLAALGLDLDVGAVRPTALRGTHLTGKSVESPLPEIDLGGVLSRARGARLSTR